MTKLPLRRVAALTTLVLLTMTAFAVGAQAQSPDPGDGDSVSGVDGVKWKQLHTKNNLYLVREDTQDEAGRVGPFEDLNVAEGTGTLTTDEPGTVSPNAQDTEVDTPLTLAQWDPYLVRDVAQQQAGDETQTVASFETDALQDSFTISGANVMHAKIHVIATPQLTWTFRVCEIPADSDQENCPGGENKNLVGETTFKHDQSFNPIEGYRPNITLTKSIDFAEGADKDNAHTFDAENKIRFEITAEAGDEFDAGVLGPIDNIEQSPARFVWLLRREGPQGQGPLQGASRLTLHADDAVKMAGWVTDFQDNSETLFTNHTEERKNDLGARLALQSAFPGDVSGTSATFRLDRLISGADNKTVHLNPGDNTSVEMDSAPSLRRTTDDEPYQVGWKLPDQYWDYSQVPPGQFRAHMSADALRTDGTQVDLTRAWDFQVADQGVDIDSFRLDSPSHLIQPGGTTTFLLEVTNTGSSKDVLDLSVEARAAVQQGWTTEIRAPDMGTGDTLKLDSGESTLVRVTADAPDGIQEGASQSFTFNATSTVDIEASQEKTLLATASDEVKEDVDIFSADDVTAEEVEVSLGPRDNATATLYIWNNATVENDIEVNLDRGTVDAKWNNTLQGPGSDGDSLVLRGVPAGDVATVEVQFQTLGDLDPAASNPEDVNASIVNADVDIAEFTVTGVVDLSDDVEVDLLDAIDGQFRFMEMECDVSICPTEEGIPTFQAIGTEENIDQDPDDAVDTMLVRTWVTNTGDNPEQFTLKLVGLSETPVNEVEPYRCTHSFTNRPKAAETPGTDTDPTSPGTLVNPDQISPEAIGCELEADGSQPDPATLPQHEFLRIGTENGTTQLGQTHTLPELKPGETAEYYVKVYHRTSASSYATSNFEFSVVAECDDCAALDRDDVEIRGRNGVEDESGVLVEPVTRNREDLDGDDTAAYDDSDQLPLVDIQTHEQDSVARTVVPGQTETVDYRVRVTHGGTFSAASEDAEVTVDISGIQGDENWKAELIPVTATEDQDLPNSVDQFTFDNLNANGDATAYKDMEFIVRVHPPSEDELTANTRRTANVIVEAEGDIGSDILELTTELSRVPDLNMSGPDTLEVQADEGVPFSIGLRNGGTSAGTFEIQAKATGDNWEVNKPFDNVSIPSQSSTSHELTVTAQAPLSPGDTSTLEVVARWDDEVTGHFTPSELQCERDDQGNFVPANPQAPVDCLSIGLEIVDRGKLRLRAVESSGAVITPGGSHTFKLEVANERNDNGPPMEVQLTPPNLTRRGGDWFAQLTQTDFDEIPAGESRAVNLHIESPDDIVEGSSHSFLVEAEEPNAGLKAQKLLTLDVEKGKARPQVSVDKSEKLIERGSFQRYEVDIRNTGTATSNFELTVDGINRDDWEGRIEDRTGLPPGDSDGDGTPDIRLPPNQGTTLFVNITSPFEDVDRGTSIEPAFVAFTDDLQSKSEVRFTARIQDYGVALSMPKDEINYVPGTSKDVPYKITNTGNGNDTLNVSMSLQGLGDEWTVTFDEPRVRLEPGESEIVEAEVQSPRSPLPSARSLTFTAWAGTTQGAAVDQWQNRSQPFVFNILEYRSQDVDNDGFVELAVDTTPQQPSDGFPHYREIFAEGENATLRTTVDGDDDRRRDFLIDNPAQGGIDGIADIYWDPDNIVVSDIRHRPDVTYDDSPDYLIDTDGDDVIDAFWNTGNLTLGTVEEISLGQDNAKQYIIDSDGDGAFDKYHDPASGLISEADSAPGQGGDTVGLDTTGDGDVDTFYNTEDESVEAATFANAGQFAQDYWYLVVLFGLVIVVGIVAVARRG